MTALGFRQAVLRSGYYVPDWSDIDRSQYLRLDRNECTQPVSDLVADALTGHIATTGVHLYPNTGPITERMAQYYGVEFECVLATNGSDQAIDIVLRSFLAEGDGLLVARPEFPVYGHVGGLLGAVISDVAYGGDFSFPYEAFRESASNLKPKLVVLINPNNPTGTPIERTFIEEMLIAYPDVPVLVDEAYFEFVGETVVDIIADHDNLIVLRSFSKAFAMAGLRLGAIVAAPHVIGEFRKLRNDFDVNALAIVAAGAQLDDIGTLRARANALMHSVKPMVMEFFTQSGVKFWPGVANFMLVECEQRAEAIEFLRSAGILVRPMRASTLARLFRMSIGSASEMERFIDVYSAYLAQ